MSKRRTQAQLLEERLRRGGMAEGDISDVLRANEAGRRRPGRIARTVALARDPRRALLVPVGTLEAIFGRAAQAFTLRPYRTRAGRVAASLQPDPAPAGAGEAVDPDAAIEP